VAPDAEDSSEESAETQVPPVAPDRAPRRTEPVRMEEVALSGDSLWQRLLGRYVFPRHPSRVGRPLAARVFPRQFFRWLRASQPARIGSWRRDRAAYTLSFDCDSRADSGALGEVCAVLKRYDLRASFACVGRNVAASPEAYVAVVEGGHEILNHTDSHPDSDELGVTEKFSDLSDERMREQIEQGHERLRRLLGLSGDYAGPTRESPEDLFLAFSRLATRAFYFEMDHNVGDEKGWPEDGLPEQMRRVGEFREVNVIGVSEDSWLRNRNIYECLR